ncbi:hypothetical protein HDU97_007712 [Phlyctochytrium planicorne]|nr:hypothetical protein HDU97_007712 [Phlyctochytrium planicorne]
MAVEEQLEKPSFLSMEGQGETKVPADKGGRDGLIGNAGSSANDDEEKPINLLDSTHPSTMTSNSNIIQGDITTTTSQDEMLTRFRKRSNSNLPSPPSTEESNVPTIINPLPPPSPKVGLFRAYMEGSPSPPQNEQLQVSSMERQQHQRKLSSTEQPKLSLQRPLPTPSSPSSPSSSPHQHQHQHHHQPSEHHSQPRGILRSRSAGAAVPTKSILVSRSAPPVPPLPSSIESHPSMPHTQPEQIPSHLLQRSATFVFNTPKKSHLVQQLPLPAVPQAIVTPSTPTSPSTPFLTPPTTPTAPSMPYAYPIMGQPNSSTNQAMPPTNQPLRRPSATIDPDHRISSYATIPSIPLTLSIPPRQMSISSASSAPVQPGFVSGDALSPVPLSAVSAMSGENGGSVTLSPFRERQRKAWEAYQESLKGGK